MPMFKVFGKIIVRWTTYCDCSYCEGHDDENTVLIKEHIVKASDAEEAAKLTFYFYCEDYDELEWEGKWEEGPEVINLDELQPDVVMRLMGAPVLPGLY